MVTSGDDAVADRIKSELKAVYNDGFNIYAAINRLKRKLKRKDNFPDEVLSGVCNSYWKQRDMIHKRWPWFIAAMEYQTRLWICDQHEKNKPDPRAPASQAIRDILKGMK